MLKLERPLCFFDLETTGLNITTSRIVSLAVMKIMPDGDVITKSRLVNPLVPIPPETTDIHGIKDEDVADAPPFKQIAKSLHEFMSGCDLGGYNMKNYDLPLISEEFARCGLSFPAFDQKLVDAGVIFKIMEQRTLTAAYKFFCGKDLEDAHDAEADTNATYEVFEAQVKRYGEEIGTTIDEIHNFTDDGRVDLANKIVRNENGEYVFNFGKSKGKRVIDDVGFAEWMLGKDFTYNTKVAVNYALEKGGYPTIPIKPSSK